MFFRCFGFVRHQFFGPHHIITIATPNEVSSIRPRFLEWVDSSNKTTHNWTDTFPSTKIFRSFFICVRRLFFCWLIFWLFLSMFFFGLCRFKQPSSIHRIWIVVTDTEEFRWIHELMAMATTETEKIATTTNRYLIWNVNPSIYLCTCILNWVKRATFVISIQYLINLRRKIIITIPVSVRIRLHP